MRAVDYEDSFVALISLMRSTLGPERAYSLQRRVRPGVRLRPDDREPALGESRLGGRPELPQGFEWPRGAEGSLPFVVQIALEAVPLAADQQDLLPDAGSLVVFADPDSAEREIVWLPPGVPRSEVPPPEDAFEALAPAAAILEAIPTLPLADLLAAEAEADADHDPALHALIDLLERGGHRARPYALQHQLLGHPAALRGDVCRQAMVDFDDPGGDWRLLLQLDGPDERLFFVAEADDLRHADYSRVWFAAQPH